MKTKLARFNLLFIGLALAGLHPGSALACAICYGEPDSPMTRGLTWAILALVLVVGCVLTGIVSFFVHANRRAALSEAGAGPATPESGR